MPIHPERPRDETRPARSEPPPAPSARPFAGSRIDEVSRTDTGARAVTGPIEHRSEALVFALLTALAAIPVWLVDFLPLQDLPQHVAAIRVLTSYGDPTFALEQAHTIDVFGTPHVAYHLAGGLLARVLGVEPAHRVLLSAVVVATPWTVRALVRAIGGDPRVSLLAITLCFGVPMMLGLLPFLAAVPLALLAAAWGVRAHDEPSPRTAIGLAALLVLTFATHVVPWLVAVAIVASSALPSAAASRKRRLVATVLVCAPSVVLALVWLTRAGAGADVLAAGSGWLENALDASASTDAAPAFLSATFADVVTGREDDVVFYAALLVAWSGSVIAAGRGPEPDRARRYGRAVVATAALVSFAIYLFAPRGHGWIWAIHMRFAWLALLLASTLVRFPSGRLGRVWVVAASLLALSHLGLIGRGFLAVEAAETAGLARVIDAIPRGERVVGLIYRPTSRVVRFAPFLHAVTWYQARRGGTVMFSFADYPSSLFRFRSDVRPPPVRPRWEWQPERVLLPDAVAWYRYVLVRGGPGPIVSMPERFRAVRQAGSWSVWRRLDAPTRE